MSVLDQVRGFDVDQLQALLVARPDLLICTSLEALANVAGTHASVRQAWSGVPRGARQVAEALLLVGSQDRDDALLALDDLADPAGMSVAVEQLRTRLLLAPGPGLRFAGSARPYVPAPLGLGRPVSECFEQTPFYDVCQLLTAYGRPRPRGGEAARAALAEVFAETEAVAQWLAHVPEELLGLLRRADVDGPVLRIPGLDPLSGVLPPVPGLFEAVTTGLLAILGPGRVELPREIGLALRWPNLTRFQFETSPVVLLVVSDQEVAAATGAAVHGLLAAVEQVCSAISSRPLPLLSSGSVGVKELRALPGPADAATAALLLRLLEDLALVAKTRKEVRVTKASSGWSARTEAERWSELARAWLALRYEPAARPTGDRKLKAGLSWDYDHRLPEARTQLARLLGDGHDAATDEVGWLERWDARWPESPLSSADGRGYLVDRELRADLLHEAEALGLLALGAVTELARALVRGEDPGPVLEALSDIGEARVRAQADMTLVCTGRPARTMRTALSRLADLEQDGAATVWRVSEQSLGRAYDEGDEPDHVLAVLAHYAGELPQAMTYLVADAHRRHGGVVVGAATAYVVVEDDLRLQDALSRRGVESKAAKAIGLRRIAPGVAVSKGSVAATMAALRDLGLSATAATGAAGRPPVKQATPSFVPARPDLPNLDPGPAARVWVRLNSGRVSE